MLEANGGAFETYRFQMEVAAALREAWEQDHEEGLVEVFISVSRSPEEPKLRFALAPPQPLPWAIAFTPNFRKAISLADRKLQGRVLSAIAELSETPTARHGNTCDPLNGDLKGFWRYRFGDYRLVYEPCTEGRVGLLPVSRTPC